MIEDMDAEELPEMAEQPAAPAPAQTSPIAQQRAFVRHIEQRAERALRWNAD